MKLATELRKLGRYLLGKRSEVEVELYHFRDPRKIIRRLNRVRSMNGLPPGRGVTAET